MPWRIVKQPNGKLARFSTVVDDFTHYDMTAEQALCLCQEEYGLSRGMAQDKIDRGLHAPERFLESISIIRAVHGEDYANQRFVELQIWTFGFTDLDE